MNSQTSMPEVRMAHQSELSHHVRQGEAWLSKSAGGENTAALSYAALELRFAVERIAIHYWSSLIARKFDVQEMHDLESFKRVERRIYDLAGHQGEIDGHFAFMRIFLHALKIDFPFHTPKIGTLSKQWHDCSALCHIAGPLSSSVPEFRKTSFSTLTAVASSLSAQVQSLGWPVIADPAFAVLRDGFVAGQATDDDVLAYVRENGLWAKVVFPDGTNSQFVGEAVAPVNR